MKTDTQNLLSGAVREPGSRSRAGDDIQDAPVQTSDRARSQTSEADHASQGRILDVARAQDVYARTEQVSGPSAGEAPDTPEEATLLASRVTAQVRDDAATALKAQAGGVSVHLVELVERRDIA